MTPISARARQWLETTIGNDANIERMVELRGSTSSSLYVVFARTRSVASFRCVLRVFTKADWLAVEPDLAEHEARVLIETAAMGLPAPKLIGFSRDDVGFGAPAVLMTFVDGNVQLRPKRFDAWVERLAETLVSIHGQHPPSFRWRYRSWVDAAQVAIPAWSNNAHLWERAIEIAHASPPTVREVFIHRDFHPTNVLWRDEVVSGVVDWANGCLGPAAVDVAHCRLNLALMYGADAADQFLSAYTARTSDFTYHPHWDIDGVFDAAMPAPKYYEPWHHFGLGAIATTTLCARLDDYLARILDRATEVSR